MGSTERTCAKGIPRGVGNYRAGRTCTRVFAEPSDPHSNESHTGLSSAYEYSAFTFETGTDQFHRNVKSILNACWPQIPYGEQMRKIWMTESVLCSGLAEGGRVRRAASVECGMRYLLPQLLLLPHALVVALGRKAQDRLRAIGHMNFLSVAAVAPPGCNFAGARESWNRIPEELHRAR